MRLTTLFAPLLGLLLTTASAASPETTHTLTLQTWPLSSSKPSSYASITYTFPSLNSSIKSHSPLSSFSPSDEIVRLGFYTPANQFSAVAVSSKALASAGEKTVKVFLDGQGEVWHVGFSTLPSQKQGVVAQEKGKKGRREEKKEGGLRVEIVRQKEGAKAVLDKPVVVNPQGEVEGEEVVEKSFLQKYWWAIAAFLVLQFVMGGGEK